MPKFNVGYTVYYDYNLTVEADNEEQALEMIGNMKVEELEAKGELSSKTVSGDNSAWQI